MVKECKILFKNELVTVVDVEGIKVQLPYIETIENTVFVDCKKGKYFIVDNDKNLKTINSVENKKYNYDQRNINQIDNLPEQ